MRPSLERLAMVFGALAMVGCGGGGSLGPPVVPATVVRPSGIGDSWTYAVTTSLPDLGNGSGTYSQVLYAGTYQGNPTIQDTETFNLPSYPNGPVILAASDELSLKGVLLAVTSGGGFVSVTSDTFSLPSTFSATTHVSGVLTLADGTVQKEDYQVIGVQRVRVPAGTFDCWVAKQKNTRNDGTVDNFTFYVDPTIGNWVKADVQILYGGGQEFDWHAQLSSMVTVPTSSTAQVRSPFSAMRFGLK